MKKLLLTLIASVILFSSCSNNEANDLQNNESKISSVLNETNYDTQKIMYQILSKENKLQIWEDKIDNMILNDDLNNDQIDLIKDLRSNLNAQIFDESENNDVREIFKNVYVKNFIKRAQFLFEPGYFESNFYTLNNKVAPIGSQPGCTCNKTSIYSCAGNTSDCQSSSSCDTTADGCGFLTMFECNGKCYVR